MLTLRGVAYIELELDEIVESILDTIESIVELLEILNCVRHIVPQRVVLLGFRDVALKPLQLFESSHLELEILLLFVYPIDFHVHASGADFDGVATTLRVLLCLIQAAKNFSYDVLPIGLDSECEFPPNVALVDVERLP